MQGAFDEQAAKPRAVDEQIARQRVAAFQCEGFDEPVFTSERDADELAIDASDAALERIVPQVAREQRRIEVQGPIEHGERRVGLRMRSREPVLPCECETAAENLGVQVSAAVGLG